MIDCYRFAGSTLALYIHFQSLLGHFHWSHLFKLGHLSVLDQSADLHENRAQVRYPFERIVFSSALHSVLVFHHLVWNSQRSVDGSLWPQEDLGSKDLQRFR